VVNSVLDAPASSIDEALRAVETIDLRMIHSKLMDVEEGKGWSADHCDRIEREYRRFLALTHVYQGDAIVPSRVVDEFWHFHILDTQAYVLDCERVFGYFLHHFPYFGMRGPEDARALGDAYDETLAKYESHFGEPPGDIWLREGMARCPNCGRKCRQQ
jgi:hypothetical protein